ncbi:hypothetical protein FB45DRAFT_886910 [Roridomyces roridus]|uniref:Uncharacterized protein n=1 Tax=Roridomyces roridus TaxID=1738132 RepID=A0AAD7G1U0_9AGAR|nr:hypothetical protein FB45DRAFT_886910 [Roridomyces roridus]
MPRLCVGRPSGFSRPVPFFCTVCASIARSSLLNRRMQIDDPRVLVLGRKKDPEIPMTDDLPLATLAQYVGPYVDFWRVVLDHWEYWLNAIFLSRLLIQMSPLVITSQSSPVACLLELGHLVEAWKFLSDEDRTAFVDGVSPANFHDRFPQGRGPSLKEAQFNGRVGVICIVRFGPNPEDLAILVVSPHYGCLKYDPALAPLRFRVFVLVRIIQEWVQRVVSAEVKKPHPDLKNAPKREAWLRERMEQARIQLTKKGILQALDEAKQQLRDAELCYSFLRSMVSGKALHDEWLRREDTPGPERKRGEVTAPQGEARERQLEKIMAEYEERVEFNLLPDPGHYGNHQHPLGSLSWQNRFRSRKANIEIMRSANSGGRNEDASERVTVNIERFVDWRRNTEQTTHTLEHIAELIRKLSQLGEFVCGNSLQSPRIATCEECGCTIFTQHNKGSHKCRGGVEAWPLTRANFPGLQRPLYPHDFLHRPDVIAHFGLDTFQLIEVHVQDIIDRPWYAEALKKALQAYPLDWAAIAAVKKVDGTVFVQAERRHNKKDLLTLAVDQILLEKNECHPDFLAEHEGVWTESISANLKEALSASNDRRKVFMAICRGAPGTERDPPHFFVARHVKKVGDGRGNAAHIVVKARSCTVCAPYNGTRDAKCKHRLFQKVDHLLHLPPQYSRHFWLDLRRGVEWKKKKGKAEQDEPETGDEDTANVKVNTTKGDGIYRPSNSLTPRNLCGKVWSVQYPKGRTSQYAHYWDNLGETEKKVWQAKSDAANKMKNNNKSA